MKRNLNKKIVIIFSTIFIILVTGIILFFKTDFFRTKRSAFFRYFNNTTDVLNIIEEMDFKDYDDKKKIMPYIRKGEATIQNSSNIADSGILDKIKFLITEKTDNKNLKSSTELLIKKDSKPIETIQIVKEKDEMGVYCEDISDTCIAIKNSDLKRIAEDIGLDSMMIPNEIANIGAKKIIEISKNERKHLLECTKILKNNVPTTADSKEDKKRIKINNKSYTTTAYSLNLNENESAEMQAQILNKISSDSILMDFFASKFKLLGFDEEYTGINTLNELMKNKANEYTKNPSEAGKLSITVFEYRQKNVRTEIKIGEETIVIDHIKDDNIETSSLKIGNMLYSIQYNGVNYSFTIEDTTDDNGQKIKVDYNQEGKADNNDVKNIITVNFSKGIKSITYTYRDSVEFTSDIGKIETFDNYTTAILNDYEDQEIKDFAESLKQKINSVYINKGAIIGINLDPLFSN